MAITETILFKHQSFTYKIFEEKDICLDNKYATLRAIAYRKGFLEVNDADGSIMFCKNISKRPLCFSEKKLN